MSEHRTKRQTHEMALIKPNIKYQVHNVIIWLIMPASKYDS